MLMVVLTEKYTSTQNCDSYHNNVKKICENCPKMCAKAFWMTYRVQSLLVLYNRKMYSFSYLVHCINVLVSPYRRLWSTARIYSLSMVFVHKGWIENYFAYKSNIRWVMCLNTAYIMRTHVYTYTHTCACVW